MNKIKYLIGVAALLLATATMPAFSQTNENPNTFFETAQSWFTSINTNFTFAGTSLEASTGYKQQVGVNAASYATVQYDIDRINLGGDIQFSGVGSAVNQIEGQLGYALVDHYSLKLDADIRFGYSTITDSGVVEPALVLKKKLTVNTYAEMGISLPEFLNQKQFNASPSFIIGAGFTY